MVTKQKQTMGPFTSIIYAIASPPIDRLVVAEVVHEYLYSSITFIAIIFLILANIGIFGTHSLRI